MSLLLLFRSSEAEPPPPQPTVGGRRAPLALIQRPVVIDDTDEVLALALALL